ncbi:hypothetical protein KCU65_g1013, partial [Aureobasidium melanogenum]
MSSHNSSDHDMQHIIKELESLQLSETTKGYFLQLLKHMDNRDKEWAKVVNMWETFESSSSGPNKAMIEIMRNVQDIVMKDDDFLKHLYKEPASYQLPTVTRSSPRVEMDNANAAASGSAPDHDKAAKDRDAAFEQGTAKGVIQTAYVQRHELYSTGSLREILHKLQDIIDKDSDFLVEEHERHEKDVKTMNDKLDEMKKKLEQQALGGH